MPAAFALTVLLAAAGPLPAGNCPQWARTNERNMVSPEKDLPQEFSPGTVPGGGIDPNAMRNVRWAAELGSTTYGNPVVAGGKVFIGTNDGTWSDPRVARDRGGVLVCLSEKTGRLLWRLRTPRFRGKIFGSGFDDLGLGICSAATVEGDRLYLVTNRGEVLCLDTQGQANGNDGPFRDEGQYLAGTGRPPIELRRGDGDIVWRFDTIVDLPTAPHDATSSSVLIHGEYLYVGTSNGVHRLPSEATPLPDAPSLIVLHKRTGRLAAVDGEQIGRRVFHGQWSSPTLGRVGKTAMVFYGAGDGVCYAFKALDAACAPDDANNPLTLKKVWSYDCNPREYKFDGNEPVDYWDGDATRATVPKDFKGPSEIIATPVFHKGRLYVAVGRDPIHGEACGILHCIDAAGTGDITKSGCVWSYKDIGRSMSTVAVADGLVYAADLAGDLHCLDAKTGRALWVHRTRQPVWSSPLVADGKVYLATQRKCLWVFAAGREKKLLAKTRLPRPISTSPVAANGVLYITTSRRIFAVGRDS